MMLLNYSINVMYVETELNTIVECLNNDVNIILYQFFT